MKAYINDENYSSSFTLEIKTLYYCVSNSTTASSEVCTDFKDYITNINSSLGKTIFQLPAAIVGNIKIKIITLLKDKVRRILATESKGVEGSVEIKIYEKVNNYKMIIIIVVISSVIGIPFLIVGARLLYLCLKNKECSQKLEKKNSIKKENIVVLDKIDDIKIFDMNELETGGKALENFPNGNDSKIASNSYRNQINAPNV